jgi:hypothetical protein
MKTVCFVLVALVMLGGSFTSTAEAGQLCWQVDFPTSPERNGYVSVMASGGKWTRAAHGVWFVQGSMYWPVAGNMVKHPDGSKWYLQLNTTFMGYTGMITNLNASTLSGTGTYAEIGGTVNTYEMTFTNISCKELPPYIAP